VSILAAALMLWVSGCRDDDTRSYATLDDARLDGVLDSDGLPDILPVSSYNIRFRTDETLDRVEGEFSFDPADFPSFAVQFESCYQPFEYSTGSQTWLFFCDPTGGHCYFSTR
jgi:hypothetical protein